MDLQTLKRGLSDGSLVRLGSRVYARKEYAAIQAAEAKESHFDLLQLTKKIQLNSSYGALLNEAFRLGRREIGASVTGSGRQITTFMVETIAEHITGKREGLTKTIEYDKKGKKQHIYIPQSEVIIYGDTDSTYFKTLANNKDAAIEIADATCAAANEQFPEFMRRAFNCQPGMDTLIKAGREVVASAGLFQAKKKYILKVVDLEGKAVDKLKSQGSEIKKADTPREVQQFLKQLIELVLDGAEYSALEVHVNGARHGLVREVKNPLVLAVAKQVNDLDSHYAEWQRVEKPGGKLNLPGHVRAAINYNEALRQYQPDGTLLKAGDKALIMYLKPNQHGWKSIAFPAEMEELPEWFDEHFELNIRLTEEKMVDNKVEGIFAAIGQPVPTPQRSLFNKTFRM
jgi:DNA polymerase elongation subunit (family B)